MIEPVIEALTTPVSPFDNAKTAMINSAALPKVAFNNAPTPSPSPKASPSPATKPSPKPSPKPPAPKNLCGAPSNPWGYNFCGGSLIKSPKSTFCSYFPCVTSFWQSTSGYVVQCVDGKFSHSGGVSGACSHHGGVRRPLYA